MALQLRPGRLAGDSPAYTNNCICMNITSFDPICIYIILRASYLFETYQESVSQVIQSPLGKTVTIKPHSTNVRLCITKNWGMMMRAKTSNFIKSSSLNFQSIIRAGRFYKTVPKFTNDKNWSR